MSHALLNLIMSAGAGTRGATKAAAKKSNDSSPNVSVSIRDCSSMRRVCKPISTQLNAFLKHLNYLLGRVSANKYDSSIIELKDAVDKLCLEGSIRCTSMDASFDQDYDLLRSLLDDIAGRTLRVPNALDRELKCDRLVTAYCNLQKAADSAASNASRTVRAAAMMDLLSYEEDSSEKQEDGPALSPHKFVVVPMRPSGDQKKKDLISARNSRLFLSPKNLERGNASSNMFRGSAASGF